MLRSNCGVLAREAATSASPTLFRWPGVLVGMRLHDTTADYTDAKTKTGPSIANVIIAKISDGELWFNLVL